MQYVRFGNTGMEVSRFCLGTMTLGSKVDLTTSSRIVDEALDHGVNFIDTADAYRGSEEMLGKILTKEKRNRVYLATKVFKQFCRDQRVGRNSRVNIVSALERSLRLLNTEYVDLYQLHHPDAETPIEETLETLDNLVRQGKVRYVGLSNHYAWQMAYMLGECKANDRQAPVSLQINYNIIDRQIERETVSFCRRFNIATMCYGPLCYGILTGKYHEGNGIPKGSRGDVWLSMRDYIADEGIARIVGALREIAAESELQMNQLAVLWMLSKPWATTVLLGGSRPEHFTQIYGMTERRLPEEIVKRIDDLSAERVYSPFANQPVREGFRLRYQP